MADSVGGGMMTGDHFSNSLYKGKMAQKWSKMTIKWLKNGLIDPKLGHIMHLWDFYEFSKFW